MSETKDEKDTSKVKVVLRDGVNLRIDGRDKGPGDTVEVHPDRVDEMVEKGHVHREGDAEKVAAEQRRADDADAQAQADAVEAVRVIEESKTRTLQQERTGEPALKPEPPRRVARHAGS